MAKVKIYLDNRKKINDCHIYLVIHHKSASAFVDTSVILDDCYWNGEEVVLLKQASSINLSLRGQRLQLEGFIADLASREPLDDLSATDIKRRYMEANGMQPQLKAPRPGKEKVMVDKRSFESRFIRFMDSHTCPGTRSIYRCTLNKLRAYDSKLSSRKFEEIDREWIGGFERFCAQTMTRNSINIALRNIRAVFNDAIDDEITHFYPFRKIKIKAQATKDRSLSADELRTIFNYPCESWQQEYVDIFKLMFMLCGINMADLADLRRLSSGRIEYDRKKTSKHYSIRVEPEAQDIIDRYRGKGEYLLSIRDRYRNHLDYLHHFNDGLKSLGKVYSSGMKATGKSLFPELSSYYARYSWATIAAELDVPRETIAAALGHTAMDVTAIYIRTDMKRKIDAANRKVIDYVLYNKN